MNMKKLIASALALVLVLGTVGCSSSSTETATTTAATESTAAEETTSTEATAEASSDQPYAGTTITYMASQDWVMDAEMELGEKFTAETGIAVDYQIVPADQYTNMLMTKLNTGECTDLFGSQAGKFDIITQLNVEKNALPLTDEWVSRLDPLAAVEVSVDGTVYGQPIQDVSAVWAVAYNKTIFDELGLEVPTTYAEFTAVCDAILAAGTTPIYECVSDGWHHTLWFLESSPVIEVEEAGITDALNGNTTTFAASATAATIVDQIKEMVDAGYWGDNYMDNTYADAAKYFAAGDYAMFLTQQGFHSEVEAIDAAVGGQNVGYFILPIADNQSINVNPVSPTRFIYSGSANAEAAQMYLAFMAEPENLQYMIDNVDKYNSLPISGAESTYEANVQEMFDSCSASGTVFQTAVKYVNPQWTEIGKELVNVILEVNDTATMLENIDKNRTTQAAAAQDSDWG